MTLSTEVNRLICHNRPFNVQKKLLKMNVAKWTLKSWFWNEFAAKIECQFSLLWIWMNLIDRYSKLIDRPNNSFKFFTQTVTKIYIQWRPLLKNIIFTLSNGWYKLLYQPLEQLVHVSRNQLCKRALVILSYFIISASCIHSLYIKHLLLKSSFFWSCCCGWFCGWIFYFIIAACRRC